MIGKWLLQKNTMARLIDADEMIKGICFIIEDSKELLTSSVVRKAMLELVDRIKTVDAPTVDGWISVKDRLPGVGGCYLVCNAFCGNGLAFVADFSTCLENVDEYNFEGEKRPGWFKYDDEYGFYEIDGITHWMPLPELPKETDTDGNSKRWK